MKTKFQWFCGLSVWCLLMCLGAIPGCTVNAWFKVNGKEYTYHSGNIWTESESGDVDAE